MYNTEHSVLRFKDSYRNSKFRTKLGQQLYGISVLPFMSQTTRIIFRIVSSSEEQLFFKKKKYRFPALVYRKNKTTSNRLSLSRVDKRWNES